MKSRCLVLTIHRPPPSTVWWTPLVRFTAHFVSRRMTRTIRLRQMTYLHAGLRTGRNLGAMQAMALVPPPFSTQPGTKLTGFGWHRETLVMTLLKPRGPNLPTKPRTFVDLSRNIFLACLALTKLSIPPLPKLTRLTLTLTFRDVPIPPMVLPNMASAWSFKKLTPKRLSLLSRITPHLVAGALLSVCFSGIQPSVLFGQTIIFVVRMDARPGSFLRCPVTLTSLRTCVLLLQRSWNLGPIRRVWLTATPSLTGITPVIWLTLVHGKLSVPLIVPTILWVVTALKAATRAIELPLHPLAMHLTMWECLVHLKLILTLGTDICLGPKKCLKRRPHPIGLTPATLA